MLTELSIRDVVLIEKLDLSFGPGLTVLTGETGAGKSILLDSLGLALGARADAGLVRSGAAKASVAATFMPRQQHPAQALLEELGLPCDDEIVLRRVVEKSGRSRAWVNDQPVGATALRRIGASLVEVQGQHDQMGLADTGFHLPVLDAFGTPPDLAAETGMRYRAWRAAEENLAAALAAVVEAKREQDFLRHATEAPRLAASRETRRGNRRGLERADPEGQAKRRPRRGTARLWPRAWSPVTRRGGG
jgi:DNA repair protein RecN (Recombination protein N)